MSDDTPTQRFPSPDDGNIPTQRIDTAGTEIVEEKQKSRGLLIGLIIAGALLLIAIIVLVVFLVTRGSGDPVVAGDTASPTPDATPSVSATPSTTPSATATPEPTQTQDAPPPPPPPSTAVKIDSFSPSKPTVFCNTDDSPGVDHNQYLHFTWKTSNADTVTIYAQDPYGDFNGMFYNLPSDGNSDASVGSTTITYFCPQATQVWRLEATGGGKTVTKDVTIKNTGDTQ